MGKNDFEKLCDQIAFCNEKNRCECNPITCAKFCVEKYVNGDESRLMRLKAEAKNRTYSSFIIDMFSLIGFAVSCFTLFYTMCDGINSNIRNAI